MGVRWTCTHVLMHVHILNKVWQQKWGGHKQNAIQRHPCFHVTMHTGLRWSQLDINKCTDACAHSYKGVGIEVG